MGNFLRGLMLAIIILLLVILVPSPALMEGLDATQAVPIPIEATKGYPIIQDNFVSEYEYRDPTIHVTIKQDHYLETAMWIARVQIAHPSQLRTAMAGPYAAKQTTTVPVMAKRHNALLAINGDYYGYVHYSVVLRQGHLYRNRAIEQYDLLMIDDQGDFHPLLNADIDAFTTAYQSFGGAWDEGGSLVNILTFGPVLIMDGKRAHDVFESPEGGGNKLVQRMIIAQDGPLSYLCISCEGPESGSRGLTLDEITSYILELGGIQIAYNLDGGSSSTLAFNGEKINSLETKKLRAVSDIVYFCSAVEP